MLVKCYHCGVEFGRHPCQIQRRNFCSRACFASARYTSVTVRCQHCRVEFDVKAWRVRRSSRLHCSRACHEAARRAAASGWASPDGYRRSRHRGRKAFVHRTVWEAANGAIPEGCVVHHKNGDKVDNRGSNLEVMTAGAHASHHHRGRQITWDIADGKRMRDAGATYQSIADAMGVTIKSVWKAFKVRGWT